MIFASNKSKSPPPRSCSTRTKAAQDLKPKLRYINSFIAQPLNVPGSRIKASLTIPVHQK